MRLRYHFTFFFISTFTLFGLDGVLFNSNVRNRYVNYFDEVNIYREIKLEKHYTSEDFYVEAKSSVSPPYIYYTFFNKKEGVDYIFPGSYVVRISKNGIDQIKIFFLNRADTFIRIKTTNEYSNADFYLLNNLVYKDIKIPLKMKEIALMPLNELISYFSSYVDFKLFDPNYYNVYDDLLNMVNSFRKAIKDAKNIPEVYDGGMDHKGEMVYIATGLHQKQPVGFNCSGFAKWVADSIYQVKTGNLLKIDDLKIRHIGIRGNDFTRKYEFERDPFFGLDWTRNIAYRLSNPNNNLDLAKIKENDVDNVKFFKYTENRGYKIEDLESILYYLAVYEQGYMYFASVSTGIKDYPGMIFHKHVVALFPYLDVEKIFRSVVMEVNDETSIKSLQKRYPNSYVHLVRVKVPKNISIIPFKVGENN